MPNCLQTALWKVFASHLLPRHLWQVKVLPPCAACHFFSHGQYKLGLWILHSCARLLEEWPFLAKRQSGQLEAVVSYTDVVIHSSLSVCASATMLWSPWAECTVSETGPHCSPSPGGGAECTQIVFTSPKYNWVGNTLSYICAHCFAFPWSIFASNMTFSKGEWPHLSVSFKTMKCQHLIHISYRNFCTMEPAVWFAGLYVDVWITELSAVFPRSFLKRL